MGRRFLLASSQYLERLAAAISAYPCTFACWFSTDDLTNERGLVVVDQFSTAGGVDMHKLSVEQDWVYCASIQAAVGSGDAVTSTRFKKFTWNHACGVFASATSRTAYLNGGGAGTNTTSKTPTGMDRTHVGANVDDTAVRIPYQGKIADAAIWSVALSAAEVYKLANARKSNGDRYRPCDIQPASLVMWLKNMGEGGLTVVPDYSGNNFHMTATGSPSPLPTPEFLLPRRRRRRGSDQQAAAAAGTQPMLTLLGVGA